MNVEQITQKGESIKMTKKLNPMLKPENRVKLLKNGMEYIDHLQEKTIKEAREQIKDYDNFQKIIYQQFQSKIAILEKSNSIE